MTMQITFVTPLFPPDVSPSATYAKTLLTQLVKTGNVTGIIYGYLPEAVAGATLLTVDKRNLPLIRLFHLLRVIWRNRHADRIIVTNGPATELPSLVLLPFIRRRLVLVIFDQEAAKKNMLAKIRIACLRLLAHRTVTPNLNTLLPLEIHPFKPITASMQDAQKAAWQTHLTECL